MKKLQAEILILAPEISGASISTYVKNEWLNYIKPDGRKWKDYFKEVEGEIKETKEGLQLLQYRDGTFVDLKRNLQIHSDDVIRPGVILISTLADYENFIENIFCTISFLFVVPELGWHKKASEMEGYLIAKELIKTVFKSTDDLQVKFISVLEQNQIRMNNNFEGMEVARSFPHCSILNRPSKDKLFSKYTSTHFELIKNLSLTFKGLVQKAQHDLNSSVSRMGENNLEELKDRLSKVLFSMRALEEPLEFKFSDLGKKIQNVTTVSEVNEIIEPVKNLLQNAKYSDDQFSENSLNIFNYSVCIVEDDPLEREILSEVFSKLFKNVYPSKNELKNYNLTELAKSIKNGEVDFDIFILDLLYERDNSWLSFNGLDIYGLVKEKYPDSVIRIVTSLPRDVISKVTEKMAHENILPEKIPLSYIFSKAKGKEVLKFSIIDRVDEIVKECAEVQKKKIDVQLPTNGIFAQDGVRKYIRQLMMHEPESYNDLVENALQLHETYKKGELYLESTGWNRGQLPSPNTFRKSWQEATLIKHLPNIMAHRLMILTEMDKVTAEINMTLFEEKVIGLVSFNNFKARDYLNTRLGFERLNVVDEEDRVLEKIILNNLFPHEKKFLEGFTDYHDDQLVIEISKDLGKWFNNTLISFEGSMGLYHLSNHEESFQLPYKDPEKNDLTVEDLITHKLTLAYLYEIINLTEKYLGKTTINKFIKHTEELFDRVETKSIPREIVDVLVSFFKKVE